MNPSFMSARDAALFLRGRGRLLIGGCTAEPGALLDAVAAEPGLWRDEILTGAFIPGVNDRQLGDLARVETIFSGPGMQSGRVTHLPLHYSAFWERLTRPGMIGAVAITVPPPAADGTFGLGLACDFAPAALAAGAVLVAEVNPQMPDVAHGPRLSLARAAVLVESAAPLAELPEAGSDPVSRVIAARIAELLRDGDTLQLGLGRLQAAILARLAQGGPARLAFHGGMVTRGTVDPRLFPGGITTGVALGDRAFYAGLGRAEALRFAPVGETHAHAVLAAIPALVSVNSAIAVDLSGQANAEYLERQVSGQGGMVDFIRGARASENGRAILALPATARGGSESRIVARLGPGTPVSVARADVDLVVTEFGVARLREADLPTRARRLAAIAAPQFRDGLLAQARGMR